MTSKVAMHESGNYNLGAATGGWGELAEPVVVQRTKRETDRDRDRLCEHTMVRV